MGVDPLTCARNSGVGLVACTLGRHRVVCVIALWRPMFM
jgi:hypothetical protein